MYSKVFIKITSVIVFVSSMLALFTGLLALNPDPLFPADLLVQQCRELLFWFFEAEDDLISYLGNILATFSMFVLCALLGDIVDMIGERKSVLDVKSSEYLIRFLYNT